MMDFSNTKIGKKLLFAFAGAALMITFVAAVGIWSLYSVGNAVEKAQFEADNVLIGDQFSQQTARVLINIANLAVRGNSTDQEVEELAKLRESYRASLNSLKERVTSDDGRRYMETWEHQSVATKESNATVAALAKAGKRGDAAKAFLEASVPAYMTRDKTIKEFQNWQRSQVAEINRQRTELVSQSIRVTVALSMIVLFGCIVAGIALTRSIVKPLDIAVSHLGEVAKGDVSRDLPAAYLGRGDEIGMLSRAIESVSVNLRDIVKDIANHVHTLSSSSTELSASAVSMTNGSRQASDKAHSVAAAAEQMAANVSSVSAGMTETASNLSSVSSNTEQMTATIGEIAGNSEKARRITEDATRQAVRISEQMVQLGRAANEIGKVTETITEISSQTNLLALNATIEAARAGSAGKGFAVVANEIKELAQQTAKATEDIKTRIENVQSSTSGGIAEIEQVSKVIHDVSEIVSSIAAAIEEQSTATKDIARNIAGASAGVKDANHRVEEASQATRDIAKEIVHVDQAAGQMASGSEQVRLSANDLSQVAQKLQTTVERFHV